MQGMVTLYAGTPGFAYPTWKPRFKRSVHQLAERIEYCGSTQNLRESALIAG